MYVSILKQASRSGCLKLAVCAFVLTTGSQSFAQDSPVVQMIKRNASNYAIDGNNNGADGQDVFLWSQDERNRNQQWDEIDRGNGRYSFQKYGTNFCLDGGNGGENGQNIYLWNCDADNRNQQWIKVNVGGGNFRLQKRNAPGFSIDGNRGGSKRQSIYLWESSNVNSNQHWKFNYLSGGDSYEPTANSLSELRNALTGSNQTIIMRPGTYNIEDLDTDQRSFQITGNNNTIDMTDVHIKFPVDATRSSHFDITGTGNTFIGGTLENTYPSGIKTITDYVSYNQDRDNLANGADMHFRIAGDDTTVIGTKMIVRGSFPFGYGSTFGIGAGSTYGLSKRAAMQIIAENTVIDGISLTVEAFGHGIFIQEPADNTTIRNSLVQGLVRETNDILAEGRGSLPELNDYQDRDGNPIERNEALSLAEDGIRSYSRSGSVRVENSTVKRMRGGIRLYLADSATVVDSTALDNGNTNFNLPRDGVVENSTGNFTYGPLHDFASSRSGQDLELTILPSPNAIGSHNIANVQGDGHNIVFHRASGPEDSDEQRVIKVFGNNSTIRNETEYTIELDSDSSGNTIISAGDVRDLGSNSVRRIDLNL